MQSLEIKAIEMEDTAFRHLDGCVHDHALYILIGIIYVLLALLAWVLSGTLRRRDGKPLSHVRPVIFIHLPGTPPPRPDTFEPFPPMRECDRDFDHDVWPD